MKCEGDRSTAYLQTIGQFREMNVNVQVFEVSSIIAINMLKNDIFHKYQFYFSPILL